MKKFCNLIFNKKQAPKYPLFNSFCWTYFFILMISGCGGRMPKPVMVEQPQDPMLTCAQIDQEIDQISTQINELFYEGKKGRKSNRLFDTLSYVFPPATLFKDFRKADKVETNALRKRHNHLVTIAREKECGGNKQIIPYKRHCKDFYTIDCVLPTTESNE